MKRNTVTGFMLLALALGAGYTAKAQTPEQRQEIIKNYDLEKIEALKAKFKERGEKNYNRALELARINNWPIMKEFKGRAGILTGVNENDEPVYKYTDNAGAAITARVPAVRTGGALGLDLNGQNMIAGMWEIGYPKPTHPDLVGRITFRDGGSYQSADSETGNAVHATHVAGTIMGSGAANINARGIAYQAANLWSYNAVGDNVEALTAAGQGLLVSNHSYGRPVETLSDSELWMKGAYSQESADWDELMHAVPMYQAVISAGNDRTAEEKDLLVGNKTSKNAIVVAAVQGVTNYTGPSSVQMSNFSSYGPADDRRIKPDISTKGVAVLSSSSSNEGLYVSQQGTSMAAPGITGCLLLMQQYYNNLHGNGEFMRAATLRGLIINTADEAGSNDGPDLRFGWGLINTTRAVEVIKGDYSNTTALIEERTLNNGNTYQINVLASGDMPLKVTIAWTDPAGDPCMNQTCNTSSPALVNDLDVRVTQGTTTHLPWKLNNLVQLAAQKADNTVDNVEVIEVANPVGEYTITVTHKGVLFDPQDYSLIVNGITDELGFSDNEFNNSISVYPNPADDIINIALGSDFTTDNCTVVMYDLQGRIVKQFSSFVETINVSDLSVGVYMLNITKGGAVASKRIIVE